MVVGPGRVRVGCWAWGTVWRTGWNWVNEGKVNPGKGGVGQGMGFCTHLGLVNGHVDAIEACVRSRKHFHIFVAVDSEATDVAIIALQEPESLHGHPGSASHKLQ